MRLTLGNIAERSGVDEAEQVFGLTRLRLDHMQLTNVDALQLCDKATHAYLHHNQISDLEPLAPLTNLQFLALAHNGIASLAGADEGAAPPLANLRALLHLDVSHNSIDAIRAGELPPALLSVDARANPCCERVGYRALLLEQLPNIAILDDEALAAADGAADESGGEVEEESAGGSGVESGEEQWSEEEDARGSWMKYLPGGTRRSERTLSVSAEALAQKAADDLYGDAMSAMGADVAHDRVRTKRLEILERAQLRRAELK